MEFKIIRKEEVRDLEPFFRACYDESGLFDNSTDEYDKESVITSLNSYLDDTRYLIRKLIIDGALAGMFIIIFVNNFLNLKHRICVEFFVRPNPILNKISKGKIMISMLNEIESIAKKLNCKRIQMQLENNNDFHKYLEKNGYRRNEIMMMKEV
jgi:hypothetical protein